MAVPWLGRAGRGQQLAAAGLRALLSGGFPVGAMPLKALSIYPVFSDLTYTIRRFGQRAARA